MQAAGRNSSALGMGFAFMLSLLVFTEGGVKTAFAALALLALWGVFALFGRGRPELGMVLLTFAIFFVDSPWGRAFYDWEPFTKPIGELLLSSMAKSLGLGGVSVSIFEAASLGMALWFWLQGYWRDEPRSPLLKPALLVAFLLPLAAIFGIIQGTLRGNELGGALTQTRSLATLPAWFFIGYCLAKRPQAVTHALLLMGAAILFKTFQGIYVYFQIFGRQMGKHEYIMEHLTSDYILTSLYFFLGYSFLHVKTLGKRLLILIPVVPMGLAHLLNHRRSSMIGLMFSLMFVIFAMPPGWLRRASTKIAAVAAFGMVFLLGTWNIEGPLGFAAHTVKSVIFASKESSRDYRIAENANLYAGLSHNILFGLGLGRRFEIVVKMDDISSIYADFNLIPHNTLIFLWAFIGPIGIAAFAAFITINIALLTRMLRRPRIDLTWILAFTAFSMVIRWAVFVYSDIGLLEVRSLAVLGLVLGTCWRLAPRFYAFGGNPA